MDSDPKIPKTTKVNMLRRDLDVLVTFKEEFKKRPRLISLDKLTDSERNVKGGQDKYSKKLAKYFGFDLNEVETIQIYRVNKAGAAISNPIFYPENYNEKPKTN